MRNGRDGDLKKYTIIGRRLFSIGWIASSLCLTQKVTGLLASFRRFGEGRFFSFARLIRCS